MKISDIKKAKGVHCCAHGCKKQPVPRKGGLCHSHYRKKRKEIDPVYDRYNSFKSKAIQRGKPFEVTLEEFRKFCQETGYIVTKYCRGKNASIDRQDNSKGYSIDNMELMSLRDNIKKYHHWDKLIAQVLACTDDVPF